MDRESDFAVLDHGATALCHAELDQDALKRAEASEAGLKQIQPDEDGEPIPAMIHPMRECEADEDKTAGDDVDDTFGFHNGNLLTDVFVGGAA